MNNRDNDSAAGTEMAQTIERIGVARFVGRINSGVVDAEAGYKALDAYVAKSRERPVLSKIAAAMLGRREPFDR